MKTNQQRLFYLDVIRVASAILIVIYHFSFSLPWPVDVLHSTVNGSWGMTPVYCFFMVSGAALMHRYGKEEGFKIGKFYSRRFLGIYPLFWIAYLIGFFAVYWQLGHLYDVPSWSLIWSIIGLDGWVVNWVPTFYMVGEWFLGSIIMLYLAFPAVRFLWRKNWKVLTGVFFLIALVLFWYHPFPMEIKQNPAVDLFYFLLGAAVEEIRNKGIAQDRKWVKAGGILFCLVYFFFWFFVPLTESLPPMEASVSAQASGLGIFLRQSFILVSTLVFYLFCMGISSWLEGRKHGKKVILEISGKSYGIFLTHHMVSQILCGHFDGASLSTREILAVLVLVFFATWLVTLGIYRIEAYIKERF